MERFLSDYNDDDDDKNKKPRRRGSLKKKILTIIVYLLFCCIMALVYMEWEYENDSRSRSLFAAKLHESVLEIEKQCPRLYRKEISLVDYRSFTMQKFDDITYMKDRLGIGDDYRKKAWTFSGAFFFVLTTTTTIGYGYPVPKTIQGKITTMFLYLVGVPFTFMALMDIVDLILTFEQFIGAQIFKWTKIAGEHIKRFLIRVCKNLCCKILSKKKKRRKRNSVAPSKNNVPKIGKKTVQSNQQFSSNKAKQSAIESVSATESIPPTTISKHCSENNVEEKKDSLETQTRTDSPLKELLQKTIPSFWIPYVSPSNSKVSVCSSDQSITEKSNALKNCTFEVTAEVHATENGSTTMIQPISDHDSADRFSKKSDKSYTSEQLENMKDDKSVHSSNKSVKSSTSEKRKQENIKEKQSVTDSASEKHAKENINGDQSIESVRIGSQSQLIPRNTVQEKKSSTLALESDKSKTVRSETAKKSLSDSFVIQMESDHESENKSKICKSSKLNKCSSDSVVVKIESDSEDEWKAEKYDNFKMYERPKFYLDTECSDNEAEMQININNNAKVSASNQNQLKGSKSSLKKKRNMKKSMKHVVDRFSVKGGSWIPNDEIKDHVKTISISIMNPSTSNMPLESKSSKQVSGKKNNSRKASESSIRTHRTSAAPSREHSFYSGPASRRTSLHSSYYGSHPVSRRSSRYTRFSSRPTSRWSSLHRASVEAAQKKEELQAAQDAESLPHLTLAFTMSNLIIYICLGAIMYVKFEGWAYLDSIYFILTSISTVGFGDLLPKGELFLLQSSFYILLGLALLAKVVGDIRRSMYNFMVQTISTIEVVGETAKKKLAQSAKKMSLSKLSKRASFSRSRKSSMQNNSIIPSIQESVRTVPSHEVIPNVKDLNSKPFGKRSLQDNSIQSKWPDHLPLPGHPGGVRPWSASMQGRYHTVSSLTPFVITDIPENEDTPSN